MTTDSHAIQPDLVTIRTFASEFEADIAKSALDAFGIDCMISRDDCGGQRPHLTMTGGIQLVVRSADVERAEEVLTSKGEEAEERTGSDLPM
jgi:Putative prokaryotic signal transducing protein